MKKNKRSHEKVVWQEKMKSSEAKARRQHMVEKISNQNNLQRSWTRKDTNLLKS